MNKTSILSLSALIALALVACSSGEGEDAAASDEPGSWWQLHDDSSFEVVIDPWPPRAGEATLRATASLGDWSYDVITERVSYRVAEFTDGFDPWVPMETVADREGERVFEATVVLPAGKQYVELRLDGEAYDEPLVLDDWSVDVK